MAEVVPCDFPAINNEKRRPTVLVLVPLNPASDNLVSYLQSMASLLEVLARQRAPNFLDQPSEQSEKILFRVADNLKLIAGGFALAKLESIQRHPRQAGEYENDSPLSIQSNQPLKPLVTGITGWRRATVSEALMARRQPASKLS